VLLPPALLALLSGGPNLMVAVIIVYCALDFVLRSLVQPRFIGDAVGLSVTVTFLSLAFWAWLLGPLGRDPRDSVAVAGQGAAGGHRPAGRRPAAPAEP
jgi:hypothetical protein